MFIELTKSFTFIFVLITFQDDFIKPKTFEQLHLKLGQNRTTYTCAILNKKYISLYIIYHIIYKLTGKLQMQKFPLKYSLVWKSMKNHKLECTSFNTQKKTRNECLS